MACTNCTKGSDGKPSGCKSNGYCSSGGCNKLNTYDWLSDMVVPLGLDFKIHEISFKNGNHKGFFFNKKNLDITTGDMVAVETDNGFDLGTVSLSGELVRLQMKKKRVKENNGEFKPIIRHAREKDLKAMMDVRAREGAIMLKARKIARELKLNMKIGEVEYQADGRKATFYYTADERVDFRELIKSFAKEFHVKIEMRQIGARQEAGLIGGIGSCGRELCCSSWLTDFKSVNTSAARYQNLSINQSKLSGQCGRLKCCLNYELNTYMDALKGFPKKADFITTITGKAKLVKTDIFKGVMYYSYENDNKFYPVDKEKVKEFLEINASGKPVESLVQVQIRDTKESHDFTDGSNHVSLSTLEKSNKGTSRNRRRNKGRRRPNRNRKKGA